MALDVVFEVLVILHFIGLAALLGSFMVQMRPPRRITPGYLHGALTMLVTGVLMVGLRYPIHAADPDAWLPNNAKIAAKLVVLLLILALVLVNRRKPELSTGAWAAIGGLSILNIVLAVVW